MHIHMTHTYVFIWTFLCVTHMWKCIWNITHLYEYSCVSFVVWTFVIWHIHLSYEYLSYEYLSYDDKRNIHMINILDIHMHIAMSHIHMHIPCLVFVRYTCINETCLIWNMHVSSIRAYFLCLDMHYKWDIAICMSAYVFNVHYKWDIAICMCAYVFNMTLCLDMHYSNMHVCICLQHVAICIFNMTLCLDMHYKWDIAIRMSAYVFNMKTWLFLCLIYTCIFHV